MSESAEAISIHNAPHYTWGDHCDGWHLVRSTGLSVIQERMPAGAAEVRHRHSTARQFFFALTGVLTLEIEGVRVVIGAGTGCEIAPRRAHQVTNESDEVVEFLVVSQPPAQGDRELVSAV